MTDTIFLITDDGMSEMSLAPYDSEELVRRLLAEHQECPTIIQKVLH